jgi:cation:H+ antiporter
MAEFWIDAVIFIAGLILIIKGADWVTDYGSRLAKKLGVSELVIGLTVVATATSLPELGVSLVSVFSGVASIATGTVIGSNISNIALILGLSALAYPLATGRSFLKQGLAMLGFSLIFAALLVDGLQWYDGAVILVLFAGYLAYVIKNRKEEDLEITQKRVKSKGNKWRFLAFTIFGGAVVVIGAQLMVTSTVAIAGLLGVPEMMIAIIIIAVGTSLPELVTSITAAMKHMRGISLGNIIGSNIFNIAVLAIASLTTTVPVTPHVLLIDIPVMLLVTVLLLLFMKTRWKLSRKEGFALLLVYLIFVALQFVV